MTDTQNTTTALAPSAPNGGALLAPNNFELAQRMATALSKSNLVPQQFQNNIPNCLIALEMASRMNASPMAVMQNLYIVHGKPAWSSQFVIAAVNSTGRFSPLRFDMKGEGDKRECIARAVELATGEALTGPPVSIEMARKEGWLGKNGSKWQTMPELMLRYRAATFFGRLYAPEVLMGMKEEGEVIDVEATVTPPAITRPVFNTPGLPEGAAINGNDSPAEGKKRGRKPRNTAPEPDPQPSGVIEELNDQLRARGYSTKHLLSVALDNKWIDKPTGLKSDDIEELEQVPLASVGEEKLTLWLENWPEIAQQLDAKFGTPQPELTAAGSEKNPFN